MFVKSALLHAFSCKCKSFILISLLLSTSVAAADYPLVDDIVQTLVVDANGGSDNTGWLISEVDVARTPDSTIAAWHIVNNGTGTHEIYVQRFDSTTLAPLSEPLRVHRSSDNLVQDPSAADGTDLIRALPSGDNEHRNLSLAVTGNGNVLLAWNSALYISSGGSGYLFRGYHITGRVLKTDDTLGNTFWLSRYASSSFTNPNGSAYDFAISGNNDGSYFLAFGYDKATTPSESEALLYGQVIGDSGDADASVAVSDIYLPTPTSGRRPISRVATLYDPLSDGYQLSLVRGSSYSSVLTVPVGRNGVLRRSSNEVSMGFAVDRNLLFREPDTGRFVSVVGSHYRRIKPFVESGTTTSQLLDTQPLSIGVIYPDFGSFDPDSGTILLVEAHAHSNIFAAVDIESPPDLPLHSQIHNPPLPSSLENELVDIPGTDLAWHVYLDGMSIRANRWMARRADLAVATEATLSIEQGSVADHTVEVTNVSADLGDFENTAKRVVLELNWNDDKLPLEAQGCELDSEQMQCAIDGSLLPLDIREIIFSVDTAGIDASVLPKTYVMNVAVSGISEDADSTNDLVTVDISVEAADTTGDDGTTGDDDTTGGDDSTGDDDTTGGDAPADDDSTTGGSSGGGGAFGNLLLLMLGLFGRRRPA